MSKFRACLAVLLVCLATFVSLPSDVQAQTLGGGAGHATAPMNTGPMQEWMDTDASNTANAMICAVIGDLGGTKLFGCKEGSSDSPLGKVLRIFCLAVSATAVLFMIWEVLSGTMSSAADGEFLGKRTNSTWVVIRTVIGGLSLIPAFGGFCFAQLVMLWATAVGIGIASAAVGTVMEITDAGQVYSTPAGLLTGKEVVNRVSNGASCIAHWNTTVDKWKTEGVTDVEAVGMVWGWQHGTNPLTGGASQMYVNFGEVAGRGGYPRNYCGTADFPFGAQNSDDPSVNAIGRAMISAMQREIPTLTRAVVDQTEGVIRAGNNREGANVAIQIAIERFDKAMKDAGKQAAESANAANTRLQIRHGDWIGYGYGDVNKLIASVRTAGASQTSPKSTPAKNESPEKASQPAYNAAEAFDPMAAAYGDPQAIENAVEAGKTMEKSGGFGTTGELVNRVKAISGVEGFWDAIGIILNEEVIKFGKSAGERIKSASDAQGGSPIRALIDLGTDLSAWGFKIFGAVILACIPLVIVSYVVPGVSGVIVGALLGVLGAVVLPAAFFGVKLAGYLPFLTAIIWTGAVLNWLVIVLESLFAAPLWAMVHLDLDGDSYVNQRTGHGYVFLLNLLFRPVMMVGALIFAHAAISACFGLFAGHVAKTLSALSPATSWWSNVLLIFGGIWVTIIFAEQIISSGMAAIFQIPDKVFTWIGGSFGSNVGTDIGHSAQGAIQGSSHAIGGAGKEMGGGAMRKVGETQKGVADKVKREREKMTSGGGNTVERGER